MKTDQVKKLALVLAFAAILFYVQATTPGPIYFALHRSDMEKMVDKLVKQEKPIESYYDDGTLIFQKFDSSGNVNRERSKIFLAMDLEADIYAVLFFAPRFFITTQRSYFYASNGGEDLLKLIASNSAEVHGVERIDSHWFYIRHDWLG
ncbi:MAG: hypothetical protein LBT59_06285 [Clostridiales bacterium]|jgi:hypothetical protein|nr:hypothetical protein [Clostridiales bacterium]